MRNLTHLSSNPFSRGIFALGLILFLASTPSLAHAPSSVTLSYDQANSLLSVTITHTVTAPSSHYVKTVEVFKNGAKVLSKDYTSQPDLMTFTYSYKLNATDGDVLKATATCSIAGSKSAEITVNGTRLIVKSAPSLPLEKIRLPPGFKIEIYAGNLIYPRSMALSPDGTLFVGTRLPFESIDSGTLTPVYAIRDENENGKADPEEIRIVDMLNNPNGVAFHDGSLYVAEIGRILKYEDIESQLDSPPEPVVIKELPDYILHGWRYIGFGPDGRLYAALGANCNSCVPADRLNATIVRVNPDGSEMEVYASGVRNSVGMDWDPRTGELWFTDNGRDLLGNDVPSDELNHAPVPGLDFGFPYCHSGSIPDPDLGSNESYTCYDKVPPAWCLGPHVAPLGMRFYAGEMFPLEYQNRVFIAEHGSWNRDMPIGYRIVAVRIDNNTAIGHEVFAEGWLDNGTVWGRPVDVEPALDGSLLISDDLAQVIYRISFTEVVY